MSTGLLHRRGLGLVLRIIYEQIIYLFLLLGTFDSNDHTAQNSLSISYCPHARELTDINDRGKVGCPSNGRGRSPRLYEGNRLSRGH